MDRWSLITTIIVSSIPTLGAICYGISLEETTSVEHKTHLLWEGNDIIVSLYCHNINFGETLHCIVSLNLTKPNVTKTVKVEKILLDGYSIWPINMDGERANYNIQFSRRKVKLRLTNVRESIILFIELDDNFEVYYYCHDYLREAICGQLRKGTHVITVVLDNASVSESFEIKP